MPQGKVKWFNSQKGYGFIAQDEGRDLFVHRNDVKSGFLNEGDTVEFEIKQGDKGPYAVDVQSV